MFGFIKKMARTFEQKAPRECLFGIKVASVAFIVACVGAAIAVGVGVSAGRPIVIIGIVLGFCGMAIYYYGLLKRFSEDKDEANRLRGRYENPDKPWE